MQGFAVSQQHTTILSLKFLKLDLGYSATLSFANLRTKIPVLWYFMVDSILLKDVAHLSMKSYCKSTYSCKSYMESYILILFVNSDNLILFILELYEYLDMYICIIVGYWYQEMIFDQVDTIWKEYQVCKYSILNLDIDDVISTQLGY